MDKQLVDVRMANQNWGGYMKYKCPCCGFYTLSERPGPWEICEVCFWEDDPVQREDEAYTGGANTVSLRQARKNYIEFGVCEERHKQCVRPPFESEKSYHSFEE